MITVSCCPIHAIHALHHFQPYGSILHDSYDDVTSRGTQLVIHTLTSLPCPAHIYTSAHAAICTHPFCTNVVRASSASAHRLPGMAALTAALFATIYCIRYRRAFSMDSPVHAAMHACMRRIVYVPRRCTQGCMHTSNSLGPPQQAPWMSPSRWGCACNMADCWGVSAKASQREMARSLCTPPSALPDHHAVHLDLVLTCMPRGLRTSALKASCQDRSSRSQASTSSLLVRHRAQIRQGVTHTMKPQKHRQQQQS
mmetsp:Transcript_9806/g.20944  ORF Transcript_9806/g.20944 Transcript_9806/m.20944 type:complete len:255 (+) Transcript_9806:222-986(+)